MKKKIYMSDLIDSIKSALGYLGLMSLSVIGTVCVMFIVKFILSTFFDIIS